MKRVFSGIQPTGNIHIGNYLGAIRNWVLDQKKYENIFCIVDLHALTVPQDPKILRKNILETAKILAASGINSPQFIQSQISAHAELAWLLTCQTPMGRLERMTQFKEKSRENRERAGAGLFNYPVLMAADILLYNTDLVPVGDDQKQHVELARDLAQRFNSKYGKTFVVPEAKIETAGARIMSLQNPHQKMSKSDPDRDAAIFILDSPEIIREKIKKAVTDSNSQIQANSSPAIDNLLTIYNLFGGKNPQGLVYSEFKEKLADAVINNLKPIQEKYNNISDAEIKKILENGKNNVLEIANNTLQKAKNNLGLA